MSIKPQPKELIVKLASLILHLSTATTDCVHCGLCPQVKSNFATTIELTDLVPYTEYTVRVSARNLYTPTAMADKLFGGPLTFRTRVGGTYV